MNTTPSGVITAVIAHIHALKRPDMKSKLDRFQVVEGDGWDALKSVDRNRVFMVLPQWGPEAAPSRCKKRMGLAFGARWNVKQSAAMQMVDDVDELREYVRELTLNDNGVSTVIVDERPTYTYGFAEAANACLAIVPFTVEFHVAPRSRQSLTP